MAETSCTGIGIHVTVEKDRYLMGSRDFRDEVIFDAVMDTNKCVKDIKDVLKEHDKRITRVENRQIKVTGLTAVIALAIGWIFSLFKGG